MANTFATKGGAVVTSGQNKTGGDMTGMLGGRARVIALLASLGTLAPLASGSAAAQNGAAMRVVSEALMTAAEDPALEGQTHEAMMAELPAGALESPLRIRLTRQERLDLKFKDD